MPHFPLGAKNFPTYRDQLAELEPKTRGTVQNFPFDPPRESGESSIFVPHPRLAAVETLPEGNGLQLDNRELLAVQHRGTRV
jgi:hypothetical protein